MSYAWGQGAVDKICKKWATAGQGSNSSSFAYFLCNITVLVLMDKIIKLILVLLCHKGEKGEKYTLDCGGKLCGTYNKTSGSSGSEVVFWELRFWDYIWDLENRFKR